MKMGSRILGVSDIRLWEVKKFQRFRVLEVMWDLGWVRVLGFRKYGALWGFGFLCRRLNSTGLG